jgi:hypothetical protein
MAYYRRKTSFLDQCPHRWVPMGMTGRQCLGLDFESISRDMGNLGFDMNKFY